MTGIYDPDPLHAGDHLSEHCNECYWEGQADARSPHLLAFVLAVGLGIVIGFVIAGSVFATAAPRTTNQVLTTPKLVVAPVPSLDFSGAVGPGSGADGDPPLAPVQDDDGGGISSALVAGTASWYDVGPGLYGAVPSYRWGDPRYKVRVCRLDKPSRCVTVTILDFCGCPGSRVIDLSRQAFARLESPSRGLVAVTVESGGGGPDATLPATDVP